MHTKQLVGSLVGLICVAPLADADVLVVSASGAGDFTTLTDAVASALDGDLILIEPGFYSEPAPVVIDDKRLTICGERPQLGFGPIVTVQPGLVVRNLSGGRHVQLENLTIFGSPGSAAVAATPALTLRDNIHHVRVQNCLLLAGGGGDNAHPDGAVGIDAIDNASLALVGTYVVGGPGQFSPDLSVVTGDAGAGIEISGGLLSALHGGVSGGDGGSNLVGGWPLGGDGGTGIIVHDAKLFLAGTGVVGGAGGTAHNGGDGGDGLVFTSLSTAFAMSGSYASSGPGGFSDAGPNGSDGTDLVDPFGSLADFGGEPLGFDVTSPVREGEVGTFAFGGHPADSTLLLLSLDLHMFPFPGYQGVLLLKPPFVTVSIAPPGNLDVPFVTPDLAPGDEAARLYIQAAYVGMDGIVLGPGRVITIVDSAF